RECVPLTKIVLMNYWPRLKAPIFLEVIWACADFAPAEIKQLTAAFDRPAHYQPVHQVVSSKRPGLRAASSIIGHDPVAKVKVQNGADGVPMVSNSQNFA